MNEYLIEELRTGMPFVTDNVTLVPIERIFMHSGRNNTGFWITALKECYAVVICDANGIRILNTEAEEIPLAPLLQAIPDLDVILATLAH